MQLAKACMVGDLARVNIELNKTKLRINDFDRALETACQYDQLAVVNRILQNPWIDPTANKNNAFRVAVYYNNISIVDRLLQDPRVDPACFKSVSFQTACSLGFIAIVVRLLQDPRIDPCASKNSAVWVANVNENHDIVDLLLLDPRVLSTDVEPPYEHVSMPRLTQKIEKAKQQAANKWHVDRAITFAPLHAELVATVAQLQQLQQLQQS